ncbi:MAG TPA: alpha/beta hydrolase, partial [Chitinophagaceae bacterium]|nr:alpha/beta hydrolase [Chitinophagaceae bacterium]
AYGGKATDAFDVVIPSIPGFGFSGKPTGTGWNPERIAKTWDVLMKRIGYNKYVSQGGDWGALIVELEGLQEPDGLLAIHTNMPGAIPDEIDKAAWAQAPTPASLTDEEKYAYERAKFCYSHVAYATMMGSRPQSLAGIADSPVGLAAFLLDHDALSYEMIKRSFNGQKEGLTRDDVLDNVTLYWLTGTALSAARIYWEYKGGYFNVRNVKIPVAVSAFPDELYQCPKSWAEKAYSKLLYYNKIEKGGHFAAWEQPEIFTREMRAAFKSLR